MICFAGDSRWYWFELDSYGSILHSGKSGWCRSQEAAHKTLFEKCRQVANRRLEK